MSSVLLIGGTGELGGRIASRLTERGIPFRALVRPRSDASGLEALGADVVRGDLADPASLAATVDGVTTVVSTATAMSRMMAGARDLSFDTVDREGYAALVRAAERAGVDRFVFVSMAGLTPAMTSRVPLARAKVATEQRLCASSMQTVIVRPAPFDEIWLSCVTGIDPGKHRATVFGHGRARVTFISADDVAEACVRLATMADPPALAEFGGPEAMSRREAIGTYERATGAKFRRIPVPRPAMVAGNRLLRTRKPAISSVIGMALVMDEEGVEVGPEPLRQLGIEPRSASDYIATSVGAVAAPSTS